MNGGRTRQPDACEGIHAGLKRESVRPKWNLAHGPRPRPEPVRWHASPGGVFSAVPCPAGWPVRDLHRHLKRRPDKSWIGQRVATLA